MNTYYITFGYEGHPYRGGWVKVHADSREEAEKLFVYHFGSKAKVDGGCLACACIYEEAFFLSTKMSKSGNYGAFCHEEIWGKV